MEVVVVAKAMAAKNLLRAQPVDFHFAFLMAMVIVANMSGVVRELLAVLPFVFLVKDVIRLQRRILHSTSLMEVGVAVSLKAAIRVPPKLAPFHCIAHRGGRRCEHKGCGTGASCAISLCRAHGGGKTCHHGGCEKRVLGKGLCYGHGGFRRTSQRDDCNKTRRGGFQ
jgi:hypothetical protein